jgi:DNA-binding NtrC family response regulator
VARVLVIDDDRSIRHTIDKGLSQAGHEVVLAENGERGLLAFGTESGNFDVLLLDVQMPEMNGLDLFRKVRAVDRKVPAIFITSDSSSRTTIEAMRLGAFDYLAKPVHLQQLRQLVDSAAAARRLMEEPVALSPAEGLESGERMIGRSPAMLEVFKAIGRVAAEDVTVLIRGESGSGKELVARALFEHSERANRPFVAVNCAALPDQLLESELFGHEKGAFTGADRRRTGRFEQCDGGTIFLDEIGDMAPIVQAKVLRVLQEQKFERVGGNETISTDVRIVAATNRNLEEMVAEGDFRDDLLYRLNGFTINLPPLRQRAEDIPDLIEYFLGRASREMRKSDLVGVAHDALAAMRAYAWPGNVRQLQSVVRQAIINTTGTVVDASALPEFVRAGEVESRVPVPVVDEGPGKAAPSPPDSGNAADGMALDLEQFVSARLDAGSENLYAELVEQVERYLLLRVLNATDGNQSRAASILGITRGKIRDRIAAFGFQLDRKMTSGFDHPAGGEAG